MECLLSQEFGSFFKKLNVLILILMECLLRLKEGIYIAQGPESLNPYSNGMLT